MYMNYVEVGEKNVNKMGTIAVVAILGRKAIKK